MKKLPDNQKSTTEEFSAVQKEGEIEEKSVAEEFSITASVGKQYRTKHYNLDAIIAHENSVSSILEHTAEYEKNILPRFTIFTPLFLLSTVYQQN